MALIKAQDCLSGLLFGYHYNKPKFSIANHFNELADGLIENISDIQIRKITYHTLSFNIKDLYIDLSEQNLMIYSPVYISENLEGFLPSGSKLTEKYVPLFFGAPFISSLVTAIKRNFSGDEFKEKFVKDTIEILRFIEKFIPNGIPKCRFLGFVENYYIPLEAVKWNILEKFNEQANIENATNTQKEATNTYYFPKDSNGSETCFIFKVIRPDYHRDPKATIAGASFDFQYHPASSQNLDELGGPDKAIILLTSGLKGAINKSKFLILSSKEKK